MIGVRRDHRVSIVLAEDGRGLATTTWFARTPVGVVVVGGAPGTRRCDHEPLARRLARHGFTTVTFDYREGSACDPAQCLSDAIAVLTSTRETYPHLTVTWLSEAYRLPGWAWDPYRHERRQSQAVGVSSVVRSRRASRSS